MTKRQKRRALMFRNRANAQHSTGLVAEAGKQISSQNAPVGKGAVADLNVGVQLPVPCRDPGSVLPAITKKERGLASVQLTIAGENPAEFEALLANLAAEHQPSTPTESLLVRELAESHWLRDRAIRLQSTCFNADGSIDEKRLSLFLRYQTTHERAFHKVLNTLLKLRSEKRKEQIGFVSQKQKEEFHATRLADLKSRTLTREIDNDIRQTVEAPLPGHRRIPFDTLKSVFSSAVREISDEAAFSQRVEDSKMKAA